MAISKLGLTYLDKQGKSATVGVNSTLMTAVNFAAVNTAMDNIVTAIEAVTILNLSKDDRSASVEKFAVGLPTGDYAVKGLRWLVRGVDSNGNACTLQIPGADLSLSTDGRTLDLTTGPGLALKTALDAGWESNDGEAVTVQEVVYLDK